MIKYKPNYHQAEHFEKPDGMWSTQDSLSPLLENSKPRNLELFTGMNSFLPNLPKTSPNTKYTNKKRYYVAPQVWRQTY